MIRVKCCLNCQKRVVGCHGSCKTYKDEINELRQGNAKKMEQRRQELEYQDYMYDRVEKSRRRKR